MPGQQMRVKPLHSRPHGKPPDLRLAFLCHSASDAPAPVANLFKGNAMFPVHDVDAFLLLAIAVSSKRRPAELVEIIAAGDLIQGAVCSELDLIESFSRLSVNGLICELDGGYTLTPDAQLILAAQRKSADAHERVGSIKGKLSAYDPKGEHPASQPGSEQIAAAVLAHQTAKNSAVRNLFVPKPKPAEIDSKRPGKRKPLVKRRR